ncbi:ABC transporter ATP-binding protein [Desulfitobacterium hafniense]|uniref:Molybdate/tungstate import ATP-binding protein WtpC n=1 Tax=Desulfitobacterium hafniense TaxID=49338 RepID=A0A098AWB4_DESHA|nr:ABC transporter ATP-binding protein [Desulfitobacterium hafniense]CDW99911.1 Molybdate/tungstate import ATP-binding protein WtpC [Desulfitobacterium hafniense]
MFRINDLCMSAGNFSVKDISLSVPEGCCHVLLGGTGNGKTLILETIAGLRPIASGEIWTGEHNITKLSPEKRFISYVPQDLSLFPHLNVEKNIFYSQRFKKNQSRTSKEISEIIECMQLEGILHRTIHNLSGGEQQRVALVRAFASGNKVLLLDEPFSALHYTMKRTLWSLLSDMQKKYGLSTLLVTHDLEEAFFLADDVSVLHQGRILQTGTKEDVFYNPNSIEVTKITGHYNYFSGKVLDVIDNHCVIEFAKLETNMRIKNNGLKPHDEVCMAIRTSNIEIIPACSDLSATPNTIISKIKSIYETSHYQQLVLVLDKQVHHNRDDILVDVYVKKNMKKFEIGQKVIVSFPEDAIHVFKE